VAVARHPVARIAPPAPAIISPLTELLKPGGRAPVGNQLQCQGQQMACHDERKPDQPKAAPEEVKAAN
jgi:hypothetical protein